MKPAIADTRKIAATIAIPGVPPGRLLHQHAGDIVMREAVVAPGKSQRGGQVGEFLGRRLTPHRVSHSDTKDLRFGMGLSVASLRALLCMGLTVAQIAGYFSIDLAEVQELLNRH